MRSKYKSSILSDFLQRIESEPGYTERYHGTCLMMQWNLLLGHETSAMISGAMEGEYDDIQDGYMQIFYNDIEDWRNIEICANNEK